MNALSYLALALGISSVGFVDVVTGADIHVISLYFVPLAFAGWRLGAAGATIASVVSTLIWLAALYDGGVRYHDDYVWAINFITQVVGFLTVSLLVATLSSKLKQEKALRRTDPLTGLNNRQAFLDLAATALTLCKRRGLPSALAFIDLDNFKSANDRFGHAFGDKLLREFGAILVASVRTSDVAARMGGDEFVVFLPDADHDDAMTVMGRVVMALEAGSDFRAAAVTASVGMAVAETSAVGMEDLLRLADSRMYRVKRQGKNGVAMQ